MDLNPQYAGIIFDCDGTLTDSMPLHFVAWRDTFARYGISFSENRFYELGGMPTNKIVALLANENATELDAQAVADEKEAAFMANIGDLQPKEQVCAVARHNKGRVPLSVASGSERASVMLQLQHIGLADAFDAIVTAEDTERHKPEPDVFLLAARLMNVDPTKCLVYEDSSLGIQAAIAAGMNYIDVRNSS